ncbi:MAG TPA: hypothetical protein V6C57_20765 [Coleofasciculaceae cyanobacterium]
MRVGSLGALFCAQPIAAQVIPDAALPVGERHKSQTIPTCKLTVGQEEGFDCQQPLQLIPESFFIG